MDKKASHHTYAFPVVIMNMAVLKSVSDFLLVIIRKLIITVNHVRVAARRFDQILNLFGRDTTPNSISTKPLTIGFHRYASKSECCEE